MLSSRTEGRICIDYDLEVFFLLNTSPSLSILLSPSSFLPPSLLLPLTLSLTLSLLFAVR